MPASARGKLAILVGGGPAPGINGVIRSVTLTACRRDVAVIGLLEGCRYLVTGSTEQTIALTPDTVEHIHLRGGSIIKTSRVNPTKKSEHLLATVKALLSLEVRYLITIGGDDTAFAAHAVHEASNGKIGVVHVPKTIDNDLPLPHQIPTFGYQTAREVGTRIVETLLEDSLTTGRWYFVISMGRSAGHLGLGIGTSSGATLTLIPEEFPRHQTKLDDVAKILEGAIVKRLAEGRKDGVAIISEGILDRIDRSDIGEFKGIEKDPHGNIRFSEIDFGILLKRKVRSQLKSRGIDITIVEKNIGYELRCCVPSAFDKEYTLRLGVAAAQFVLGGKTGAMITIQHGASVPIPFEEMLDPNTRKTAIRYVDLNSEAYRTSTLLMNRLTAQDLDHPENLSRLAAASKQEPNIFQQYFGPCVNPRRGEDS